MTAALLVGCAATEEPTPPPVATPAIDLAAGEVDPALVGVWKSPEETYRLAKDGTFTMRFDRMEQTGPSSRVHKTGDLGGRWATIDDALLLRVDKGENGAKHRMNVVMHDGGTVMELRPTFMRKGTGTMYRRARQGPGTNRSR